MKDNLNSRENSVMMNFNTRDVRDIHILNMLQPKQRHRKTYKPSQEQQLEPAKRFQSLYATPSEAPMGQLNRFYVPERIRGDGVDVASQIQEPSRTFGKVREDFQAVVPPAKGEEFVGTEEFIQPIPEEEPIPSEIGTEEQLRKRLNIEKKREELKKQREENIKKIMEEGIIEEEQQPSFGISSESFKQEEQITKKGYRPNEKYILRYSRLKGITDRNEIIKQLQKIADEGPNENRGANVANWLTTEEKKLANVEGLMAAKTMKQMEEQSRLQSQPKLERTQQNPEGLVYAFSK